MVLTAVAAAVISATAHHLLISSLFVVTRSLWTSSSCSFLVTARVCLGAGAGEELRKDEFGCYFLPSFLCVTDIIIINIIIIIIMIIAMVISSFTAEGSGSTHTPRRWCLSTAATVNYYYYYTTYYK